MYVRVTDVSQVKYVATPDGKIYLRNLDQFASVPGCCWNYYIDTTTSEGCIIRSLFLTTAAQGKSLNFGVPDNNAAGANSFAGDW